VPSSENSSWSVRKIRHPDRHLVEWLCLGSLGDPAITVGILRDGSWVVDTADGLASLRDQKALTFAFPVLRSEAGNVRVQLEEFGRVSSDVACGPFPLRELVIHAITTGGYWAEQAFHWLPVIEIRNCDRASLVAGLLSIENNRDYSQKLRHQAMKQRNKLSRPEEGGTQHG
jgi:hypothetical protein